MIIILTYDITHPRRLRRMHRFMKDFGLNTQKSVFECDIDEKDLKTIRRFCRTELDIASDSVRIYGICAGCLKKAALSGMGLRLVVWDYAIV
ncbi:MAG: CRISPR-associated endonuclease Cas2 [Thermodesulfobacteriota bacterium]|nr:CRISPR-associated endonuclease Cas2 [Thermodesulfobacteriota bacterium]